MKEDHLNFSSENPWSDVFVCKVLRYAADLEDNNTETYFTMYHTEYWFNISLL